MTTLTRRSFAAALMTAASLPLPALLCTRNPPRERRPYLFFGAAEAAFVEAACERLIPADGRAPGALDADVPHYLDEQLQGPWGRGEVPYRHGVWQPGTPTRSSIHAPAQFFRAALRAIDEHVRTRGIAFGALAHAEQDAFLAALAAGGLPSKGVPLPAFFAMLLQLTVEGFFSHPRYGTTRDRVAWRIQGFAGAFAREDQ